MKRTATDQKRLGTAVLVWAAALYAGCADSQEKDRRAEITAFVSAFEVCFYGSAADFDSAEGRDETLRAMAKAAVCVKRVVDQKQALFAKYPDLAARKLEYQRQYGPELRRITQAFEAFKDAADDHPVDFGKTPEGRALQDAFKNF